MATDHAVIPLVLSEEAQGSGYNLTPDPPLSFYATFDMEYDCSLDKLESLKLNCVLIKLGFGAFHYVLVRLGSFWRLPSFL